MIIGNYFASQNSIVLQLLLWSLFGFVISHLDCNLQNKLINYPVVGYVILFFCCFFLFIVPHYSVPYYDDINKMTEKIPLFWYLFINCVYIFVFFIFWLKCRWDFAAVILLLLCIEGFLKLYMMIQIKENGENKDKEEMIKIYSTISSFCILFLLCMGVLLNFIDVYKKNKNKSLSFFLLFSCKT